MSLEKVDKPEKVPTTDTKKNSTPYVPYKPNHQKQKESDRGEADLLVDKLVQQTSSLIPNDKVNEYNRYTAAIDGKAVIQSNNILVISIPHDMLDTRDAIESRYKKLISSGCSISVNSGGGELIAVIEKSDWKIPVLVGDLQKKVENYGTILYNQNGHAIVFIPGKRSGKQDELQNYINGTLKSKRASSSTGDNGYFMHIEQKSTR